MALRAALRLLRLHQWPKNAFVLAGVFFAQAWGEPVLASAALQATLAFCLASSLVYAINDWRDREADARHPDKCRRPFASGALGARGGLLVGAALLAGLAPLLLGRPLLAVLVALYLAVNLGYSFGLKHVAVLDVALISSGFMLRLLAGTVAVGIPPSRWLLVTGLFLTLYLGFAKRRAEAALEPARRREVLDHYSLPLLDTYVAMAMTATLVTYALYATAPETQALHGERLVFSLPLVVLGLLRYTQRVHRGEGEDLVRAVARDPLLLACGLGWIAIFLFAP